LRERDPSVYPFSAIVGQDALKSSLLLNAVDPRIGGVLIRGHKGTAKSTAVRALAGVLPEIEVVEGCRYGCDPEDDIVWCSECRAAHPDATPARISRCPNVVDLPVSATEDRLVGSLDIEHALKHGERRFEPGLLADANRGILYVDEVNLLDDHLVDTLLDAAAMGVNTVEREGVGFTHPARFILVGTMNPEEGDVRPQLLDRFGLCVDVEGLNATEERVEVVRRRQAFEDHPGEFLEAWQAEQEALRVRVGTAIAALDDLSLDNDMLTLVARMCAEMAVDGHRADLTLARTAAASCALAGRPRVEAEDVAAVAPLVLTHRVRQRPLEEPSAGPQELRRLVSSVTAQVSPPPASDDSGGDETPSSSPPHLLESVVSDASSEEEPLAPRLAVPLDGDRRQSDGRRQETRTRDGRGRYSRAEPARAGETVDIAIDATIREAAVHQSARETGDMAVKVEPSDIRNKVRTRRCGASIVFCVDASGSMGAATRMEATKSAVLDLLVDAYQRRDRVGLVSFRGEQADLLLAPTASVELAQMRLRSLPTGGSTPLAHGIKKSLELLQTEVRRNTDTVPWLVLVTDGRANVGLDGGLGGEDARQWAERVRDAKVNSLVLDTNASASRAQARELARLSGGDYVRLESLDGALLAGTVRRRLSNA
jgi:magnesium chelatase subunit D